MRDRLKTPEAFTSTKLVTEQKRLQAGHTVCAKRPPLVAAACSNLVEVLRAHVEAHPDRVLYEYVDHGGEIIARLTFGDLETRARAIASYLQELGTEGRRVLLLYPHGADFIAAFFGCLYAGSIAIPAYPPRRRRGGERLAALCADSRAGVVLTSSSLLSVFQEPSIASSIRPLRTVATDLLDLSMAEAFQARHFEPQDVAMLQYTSGSTAFPKGVRVTHGNLYHNEDTIRRAFDQSADSVVVSWLPLYHDMGLIGGLLQPLFVGAHSVILSPMSFLQRPVLWLETLSRFRGTTSGGPNFAYDLCVVKVGEDELAQLDLSNWRLAFNGSEPVRRRTLDRFAARFARCGFDPAAFFPCYGLAEATLFVAGGDSRAVPTIASVSGADLQKGRVAEAAGDDRRELVGCGHTWPGTRVRVVDPALCKLCAEDRVGEIWVAGDGVAAGYANHAENSEEVFRARLADCPGEGPFLRTGDLGFWRDGELFVTGRLKDLIIVRGRNYHPQDLELTAERSHPTLQPGCAAFSISNDDEEVVVLVQEVHRRLSATLEELTDGIRKAVALEHGLNLREVVLVRSKTIPRTSSGKIRRRACRCAYLDNTLAEVGRSRFERGSSVNPVATLDFDREDLEGLHTARRSAALTDFLKFFIRQQMALSEEVRISNDQPLCALGVDSLKAVEIKNALESRFGAELALSTLLGESTLNELRETILRQVVEGSRTSEVALRSSGDDRGRHPLSHDQAALWFLERLEPGNPASIIARAARIRGELDVDALRRSLTVLLERHSILRSTFGAEDGRPYREVRLVAEMAPSWFVEDEIAEAMDVATRLEAEAYHGLDLWEGPVLRVVVLHCSSVEHYLLLSVHHLVADLWSLEVLLREFALLYGSRGSSEVSLEPLPLSYADYVRWQTTLLASARGAELWRYWREQLAGDLPELALPIDRPRPKLQSFQGATLKLPLEPDLGLRIETLARERQTTLYTVLLAAFSSMLHHYTRQNELLVGSPVAGRGAMEIENLVGYFAHPVVIRADLAGDPSFDGFLAKVHRTVLDAFDHQELPFALLAERLAPQRDPSRSPIFEVMFVFEQERSPSNQGLAGFALGESGIRMNLGGLKIESLTLPQRVSQLDLTLLMADVGGRLSASIHYKSGLFDATTILRFADHFRRCLTTIAEEPWRRISQLSSLSPAEHHQLLREWNDTAARYDDGLIHERFEASAAERPEAVAVVSSQLHLTYRELDRRSNRLAHDLAGRGVGPETPVALCVERSPRMIIGLLGILKAGGYYLPLPPGTPSARLEFALRDSGARLLLTQQHLVASLPKGEHHIVFMDRSSTIGSASTGRPSPRGRSSNLAYTIFTSGSTGRPKGVPVAHLGLVNLTRAQAETFGLGPGSRVLQFSSSSFDASIFEFFLALTSGATLVLAPDDPLLVGSPLQRVLRRQRISFVVLPPSALATLDARELPELGTVTVAGEACSGELVRLWAPNRRFFNLYGPTESTIWASAAARPSGSRRPCIGRPIRNLRAYIVDRFLEPVPVGVLGELCLGGESLARGYLRRQALTAEKFVPDPFGPRPGQRLYRTGDLARWTKAGELDFHGRFDHQVKLRGFRIELGEIEAVLSEHPKVREAIVVVRGSRRADRRLAACLLLRDPELSPGALKDFLRQRLPGYMVPSSYHFVEEFPRTTSGKVDRNAISRITSRPERHRDVTAARNALEKQLTEIWAEVLAQDCVGIDENFFELGGDSLQALRIVSKANALGFRFTPGLFYRDPTIAELAEFGKDVGPASRGNQEPVTGTAPLTPIQHWFFEQDFKEPQRFNIGAQSKVMREIDPVLLRVAFEHLQRHHDALRLCFGQQESSPVQLFRSPENVPSCFGEIDLTALDEELHRGAIRKTLSRIQGSLNLSRGPLVRIVFFSASPSSSRLLVAVHHLVADGVSLQILLEDLHTAYEQLSSGETVALPPKTTSYKEWAEHLSDRAEQPELRAEAEFWCRKPWSNCGLLPADFPEGANINRYSLVVVTELTPEETRRMLRQAALLRVEVSEMLLTALALALREFTGNHFISFDLIRHGREAIAETTDLTRTVGWFNSLSPLLLELTATADPTIILQDVVRQVRSVPRRGLGYQLLRFLGTDPVITEAIRRIPRQAVRFNYLGRLRRLPADSLFEPTNEAHGDLQSPQAERPALVNISAAFRDDLFKLSFVYSRKIFRRETIDKFSQDLMSGLHSLLALSSPSTPSAPGLQPPSLSRLGGYSNDTADG